MSVPTGPPEPSVGRAGPRLATSPAGPAGPEVAVGRGGPQVIPRPPGWRPGLVAPWAHLSAAERTFDAARLRDTFDPSGRPRPSPMDLAGGRPSAVLAPFYEDGGRLHVVLTRRAWHMRTHRGEVSFPGGTREGEEDLRTTALRESFEEIRLDPSSVEILGELDHINTVTGPRYIVPYVGLLPGPPELEASPHEVEAVLCVPVDELLDPTVFREECWMIGATERPITFFELVGDTVWGATGAMLRMLLTQVLGVDDPALRAIYDWTVTAPGELD